MCQVFEYKRLVQDSSRQVRESSHIAMTALVNSVGYVLLSRKLLSASIWTTSVEVKCRMVFVPLNVCNVDMDSLLGFRQFSAILIVFNSSIN